MKKLLAPLAVLLLAACSDDSTRLSLSTRAGTSPGALTLSNGVTVDRVRIVVDRVRLDPAAEEGLADPEADRRVLLRTPVLVDLDLRPDPATGLAPAPFVSFDAPAGTYEEIELRIHKINPGEARGADAEKFADLAGTSPGNGASIRIDGFMPPVGGVPQPFAYLAFFEEELELAGPFTIAEEQENNITLNVDPTGWFTGAGGELLDPRDGSTATRQRIERNIKASLRAFDDDDRDGRDDD